MKATESFVMFFGAVVLFALLTSPTEAPYYVQYCMYDYV